MSAAEHLQEAIAEGCTRDDHDHVADHRAEVLAEAVSLIEAARAADEAMYRDEPAQINRRVGMREAMALLRREYEPAPEPSRRPHVKRATEPEQPAGPMQYGIRYSTGDVQPVGGDHWYAAALADQLAHSDPNATLVQRTITTTEWTVATEDGEPRG